MSEPKKPAAPLTGGIFANALASTPKYVDAGVSAGMHNTLTCPTCGATREKVAPGIAAAASDLQCRYCGTSLLPPAGGAK